MSRYDAIVIGGGTNGLVAAHMLAKKGRRVAVIEQQQEPGNHSDLGWVHQRLINDLNLLAHGLVIGAPDPWITVPTGPGESLSLWRDATKTQDAIRRFSPRDAAAWPAFCERMHKLVGVLEGLYVHPAPDVDTTEPGELLRLGLFGLKVRGLGARAVVDLLRVLPMPVAELLDDWFECDALKVALGATAVSHLRQGPRSGGTAFTMLHHSVGSPGGAFHPPVTNLGHALATIHGIDLRRGRQVARIEVANGRATGVTLDDGERLEAAVIASSADPQHTLLEMLEPGWLDPEFARAIANIKSRSVTARILLYTNRPAGFPTMLFARNLDQIERAFDASKYGKASAEPYFQVHAEQERIVAYAQYVPYDDSHWDEARRRAVIDAAEQLILAQVPGVAGTITSREVETPSDRRARYGQTGGHVYQGELTLDQILFMRPVPGWSRYRMPVDGLYLCGAGTHPGGAIAGGAGWLAAKEILKAVRR